MHAWKITIKIGFILRRIVHVFMLKVKPVVLRRNVNKLYVAGGLLSLFLVDA